MSITPLYISESQNLYLETIGACNHWRIGLRSSKILGGNKNIGVKKVAITDEIIGSSQLLGARAPVPPPKKNSTPVHATSLFTTTAT